MFKKNLNRKVLANIIHQNIGFSKIISENIVNDIFYIIISGFKENEKVKITSFGTFQKRRKNERIGRNPKTGKTVNINERYVPHFKPGKNLKKRVNQGTD